MSGTKLVSGACPTFFRACVRTARGGGAGGYAVVGHTLVSTGHSLIEYEDDDDLAARLQELSDAGCRTDHPRGMMRSPADFLASEDARLVIAWFSASCPGAWRRCQPVATRHFCVASTALSSRKRTIFWSTDTSERPRIHGPRPWLAGPPERDRPARSRQRAGCEPGRVLSLAVPHLRAGPATSVAGSRWLAARFPLCVPCSCASRLECLDGRCTPKSWTGTRGMIPLRRGTAPQSRSRRQVTRRMRQKCNTLHFSRRRRYGRIASLRAG